jgi:thymidylate synthase
LIDKIKRRVSTGLGSKTHYELAVADEAFELTTYLPEKDKNYPRGGPCLSHISIKVDDEGKVRLTAFYRSHYYVEKALGNLVGLARLQAFIALEAGAEIGPLTCIASQAILETHVGDSNASAVSALLKECGA